MADLDTVLIGFEAWYRGKADESGDGIPPRGNIAAALVVLERLRDAPALELDEHVTGNKGQIAGLGRSSLDPILHRLGETREYSREGGRTNRGNHGFIESMFAALSQTPFESLHECDRASAIDRAQEHLFVLAVTEWFNRQRLQFEYDPRLPARAIVGVILTKAKERGQDGYVAQHLVGAKLELRYRERPMIDVPNYAGAAADVQADRAGDFQIGDTAFHVTVSPSEQNVQRCLENLGNGLSAFLLVPDERLAVARGLADLAGVNQRISVEAIESFVGQNVSELAGFDHGDQKCQLADLLEIYNQRVDAVESDKSLMIEVPLQLNT